MQLDKSLIQFLAIIVTTVISSVVKYFGGSANKEITLNILRNNLLKTLRLSLSIELSKIVPRLEKGEDEGSYIARMKESLLEYLGMNSRILIDLLKCEKLYSTVKKRIRLFKYMPVLILIISTVGFIFLPFLFIESDLFTNLYIWGGIILFIILLLWLIQERSYDKFTDLCEEYEITEEKN